jgi:hypothetical protein
VSVISLVTLDHTSDFVSPQMLGTKEFARTVLTHKFAVLLVLVAARSDTVGALVKICIRGRHTDGLVEAILHARRKACWGYFVGDDVAVARATLEDLIDRSGQQRHVAAAVNPAGNRSWIGNGPCSIQSWHPGLVCSCRLVQPNLQVTGLES